MARPSSRTPFPEMNYIPPINQAAKPVSWTRAILICYVPFTVAAVVWLYLDGGTDLLHERVIGAQPGVGLLIGTALGLGVVGLSRLLTQVSAAARGLERAFIRMLGPLSLGTCLLLASTSALAEEIFFRGALQLHLGFVWTSLLFGLMHVPFDRSLILWMPFAVAMGFLLGWTYEATETLAAPIATHFVINFLNLLRMRGLRNQGSAATAPGVV